MASQWSPLDVSHVDYSGYSDIQAITGRLPYEGPRIPSADTKEKSSVAGKLPDPDLQPTSLLAFDERSSGREPWTYAAYLLSYK